MPFFATTTHSGDGATTTFSIGFTYLRVTYVKVFLAGVEQTRPAEWDFDGGGTNVVFVTPPPSATDNIVIERQTDLTSRLVDFSDGANLTEEDLDTSAQQPFDILQEQDDDGQLKLGQVGGVWDAGGLRIINVGSATAGTDASTKDDTAADAAAAAASAAAASTDADDADTARIAAVAAQTAAETAQTACEAIEAKIDGRINGPLAGLEVTRSATDTIQITAGGPFPDTDLVGSTWTKDVSVEWVAGTGNGGLANGLTFTADTGYYIHLLWEAGTTTVDFGADTSATAANLLADADVVAAGLDTARPIAIVVANSGATDILEMRRYDNYYELDDPIVITSTIFSGSNIPEAGGTPGGIVGDIPQLPVHPDGWVAVLSIGIGRTGGSDLEAMNTVFAHPDAISNITVTDTSGGGTPGGGGSLVVSTANASVNTIRQGGGQYDVATNSDAEIAAKTEEVALTSSEYNIVLNGWKKDFRGALVS